MKRKSSTLIIFLSLFALVYFASVFAIDKPTPNPIPPKTHTEELSPDNFATKEWENFKKMDEETIWDKMGVSPIL